MKKALSVLLSFILLFSVLTSTSCNLLPDGTSKQTETKGEDGIETEESTDSDSASASKTETKGEDGIETEESTDSDSASASKTETNTESESESELTVEETYADLSGEFVPVIKVNNSAKAKASSTGASIGSEYVIRFDGNEANYSFASFGMSSKHDASSCSDCKYTEINGEKAFYMHTHSSQHIGVSIDLKAPINASLVTGATVTVMTDKEITNASQVRLFKRNETSTSEVINLNGYSDLAGATQSWKTIDFKFDASDIKRITEADGYIHGFKMMLRDKDNTGVYIKDITFTMSIQQLCQVDAVYSNSFGRGDALQVVANKIAENLTDAGIGAAIELRCSDYKENSTAKNGSLTYKVLIKTADGNELSYSSMTTSIKKIEGIWLPLNYNTFGTRRDAKKQWKTGFDRSGIIVLEDNVLIAKEGLADVEYAVIAEDADVTDQALVWLKPHFLKLNANGIDALYANAALDYGTALKQGEKYRFVLRGVTENENYILHLDIPFTYSALSSEPVKALEAAMTAIGSAKITCKADEQDKAEYIKSELEKAINNDLVSVSVKTTADGLLSGQFEIKLSYVADVQENRFPSYSLSGETRSDFFAYNGKIYTTTRDVVYAEQTSDIVLTAPADGQTDLRISSEEIVKFWNSDTDIITTTLYDYKLGELCDPIPVTLKWDDRGGAGKTYTVSVAETKDFKNAWTYQVSDTKLDVYNLKAGQRYYWKVERDGCVSATLTFVTEASYPRYILTEKVSNFRDIGGYKTTDGKTVKQGLAFRLSNFDAVNSSDIDIITNYLGVKTELDFRSNDKTPSTLGNGVTAKRISIKWYNGIFSEGESEPIRQAISVFADENNYPIGYHCAIGRDRTGTVSILLLGLLGVDEDTILKEFMISKNSVSGGGDGVSAPTLYNNYASFVNGLRTKFGNQHDTFQEQVEAYLLSIGITEKEIASIRNNFLED